MRSINAASELLPPILGELAFFIGVAQPWAANVDESCDCQVRDMLHCESGPDLRPSLNDAAVSLLQQDCFFIWALSNTRLLLGCMLGSMPCHHFNQVDERFSL